MRKIVCISALALACLGAYAQTPAPLPQSHAEATSNPPTLTLARAFDLLVPTIAHLRLTPDLSALEQARVRAAFVQHKQALARTWINAVAAQQSLADARDNQAAAQAGAALGQRMLAAGNWSQVQLLQAQRNLAQSDSALAQAQQLALSEREQLNQTLGLSGPELAWPLPALPKLPAAALELPDVETKAVQSHVALRQAQLEAAQRRQKVGDLALAWWQQHMQTPSHQDPINDPAQPGPDSLALSDWTDSLPRRSGAALRISPELDAAALADIQAKKMAATVRSQARLAYAHYRQAYALARQQQEVGVALHLALQEEAQLRYNGMLASVWDLLASAQDRLQSQQAALQALRDFWLAHLDLQAVLAGVDPHHAANLK